jgi:hypothetical protein
VQHQDIHLQTTLSFDAVFQKEKKIPKNLFGPFCGPNKKRKRKEKEKKERNVLYKG